MTKTLDPDKLANEIITHIRKHKLKRDESIKYLADALDEFLCFFDARKVKRSKDLPGIDNYYVKFKYKIMHEFKKNGSCILETHDDEVIKIPKGQAYSYDFINKMAVIKYQFVRKQPIAGKWLNGYYKFNSILDDLERISNSEFSDVIRKAIST